MTTQISFSRIENELLPDFRNKISSAESTEDVKKFFAYIMQALFNQAYEGTVDLNYGDIALSPEEDPPFSLSDALRKQIEFTAAWNSSDLPHVVRRFSESASNRFRHLKKKPEKTEQKIRK